MREFKVERFSVSKGRTEETTFKDECAALWFAVELSYFQEEGNWISVYNWNGYNNLPGAMPLIRWSCSALRKVDQGLISYVNIH